MLTECRHQSENENPIVAMFIKDPLGFFAHFQMTLDLNELTRTQEPTCPEVEADIAMVRDLVAIEQELRLPAPSHYVLENAERLRAEAIASASRGRTAALANSSLPGTRPEEEAHLNNELRGTQHTDRLISVLEQQTSLLGQVLASSVRSDPATAPTTIGVVDAPIQKLAKPVPLFSEATAKYLADRINANGEKESADIKSIRRRVAIFLAIVGDKRVDSYEHDDFQTFVNALQYWPPTPNRHPALKGKSIEEILALNKKSGHAFGILGEKTVAEHYLTETQTILGNAVVAANIAHPIPAFKLVMPNIFKATEKRIAPNMLRMTEAFRLAIASGELDQAMLILLGMLCGRRLGLLVYLRGTHFKRVRDYVVVKVPQHITDPDTGRVIKVPIKTKESLTGFILHRLFDECGFADFAMSLGDQFLFPRRHQCVDPVDAAQKMVNGILEQAEAGGTFHGLRHWYITKLRLAGVSDYSTRVQVGHAGRDEHEAYGDLPVRPEDASLIYKMELPEEVDFSLFKDLDFDRLRTGCAVAAERARAFGRGV